MKLFSDCHYVVKLPSFGIIAFTFDWEFPKSVGENFGVVDVGRTLFLALVRIRQLNDFNRSTVRLTIESTIEWTKGETKVCQWKQLGSATELIWIICRISFE